MQKFHQRQCGHILPSLIGATAGGKGKGKDNDRSSEYGWGPESGDVVHRNALIRSMFIWQFFVALVIVGSKHRSKQVPNALRRLGHLSYLGQ